MSDPAHIHLISDSTGETLHAVLRAVLAAFQDSTPEIHISVFVRSERNLAEALDTVSFLPGLVIYTLADDDLRAMLVERCEALGVPMVAPLQPVIKAVSAHLRVPPLWKPGSQHRVTDEYFHRIAALDYAMAHDDGALGERLMQADVILTGVSRTSKTPTCIYLAHRGIKAANVPLVPKTEPDQAFFDAIKRGVPVIGLTASPSRLTQVRAQRLEVLGATRDADYAELDQIREEVADARLFFDRHGIPVIDVTRRSIEETAAEIQVILRGKDPARV
jgi:regulator of PEP synthase PpsR (kinase-PPPase family)